METIGGSACFHSFCAYCKSIGIHSFCNLNPMQLLRKQPVLSLVYGFVYVWMFWIGGCWKGALVFVAAVSLLYVCDYLHTVWKKTSSQYRVRLLPESSSVNLCPICLDDGIGLSILPCGHAFHQECVLNWFQTQNERDDILPDENSCP